MPDVAFRGQTEVANESTDSVAIAVPSAAETGDLAYAIIEANAGSVTFTPPSGWDELTSGDEFPFIGVFRKVLEAGDLGTDATFGMDSTVFNDAVMIVFSGADGTTPEDVTAYNFALGGQSSAIPCPSVTTTAAGEMVLIFAVTASDVTFTGPDGWEAGPSVLKIATFYTTEATEGATGINTITQSAADNTGSFWGCGTIAIRGASGTPTVYTSSPSGTMTLAGATVTARRLEHAPEGALALSGSAASRRALSANVTGSLSLSGAISDTKRQTSAPTGAMGLSGALVSSRTYRSTPSGALRLAGTATSHGGGEQFVIYLPTTAALSNPGEFGEIQPITRTAVMQGRETEATLDG